MVFNTHVKVYRNYLFGSSYTCFLMMFILIRLYYVEYYVVVPIKSVSSDKLYYL